MRANKREKRNCMKMVAENQERRRMTRRMRMIASKRKKGAASE
jgi:hypothetical protein